MKFDDVLKAHLPRAWFRFKFFKYKYRGRGEPELRLIRHLIAPGTTALDVGASFGMYAAEMARYAARVIAFEANPEIAAFTASVAPRNVEVMNVALSSASGRATLRMPLSAKGHGVSELGTIDPGNALQADTITSVGVEMKRLDDLAVTNCSFIKIDTEGHEEAVLDGAAGLIAAQHPVLLIELDERLNAGSLTRTAQRLTAQRYRALFLSHGRLRDLAEFVPERDQDEALLKYARHRLPAGREYINNFVFVPEEKAERLLALRP